MLFPTCIPRSFHKLKYVLSTLLISPVYLLEVSTLNKHIQIKCSHFIVISTPTTTNNNPKKKTQTINKRVKSYPKHQKNKMHNKDNNEKGKEHTLHLRSRSTGARFGRGISKASSAAPSLHSTPTSKSFSQSSLLGDSRQGSSTPSIPLIIALALHYPTNQFPPNQSTNQYNHSITFKTNADLGFQPMAKHDRF